MKIRISRLKPKPYIMRLFLLFLLVFLAGCNQPLAHNKTITINTHGKVTNGLIVSISSIKLPDNDNDSLEISASLKNGGNIKLTGIIESSDLFLIEVDGDWYGSQFFEGKSSYMPPERVFGPIKIEADRFRKINKSDIYFRYDKNADRIKLKPGKHKIRIYYKLEMQKVCLIPSQEIEIISF